MLQRESTRRELLTGLATATAVQAQTVRKPNVLYVFSDQHRACSMPGMEYNDVNAPTFISLASQGTTFSNCISNYPVCSPYRGILMSGRWPYQTGVIDNSHRLKESEYGLGEAFRDGGYHTGYVGKWHLDARGTEGYSLKATGESRHGFAEWRAWYNTNPHYDRSHTYNEQTGRQEIPDGYNATLMTDDAISFIKRNREKPWMLVVSWNPPHPPFNDAPPDLVKKYIPGDLQLRPNTVERVPRGGVISNSRGTRYDLAGYNAHIEGIDIEMARLLKSLDETGQADNTVIVYTSDHGEMLGAHHRTGKRLPYQESCNVPFIVRGPGIKAGQESDVMLGAIDIYPTLCGMAGLPVPESCEGQDLSGVARGESNDGPEHQFLMHITKNYASHGINHPAPLFRGIRTKRYTYACGEIGRWCLYDNQEDPYQQHNLADDLSRLQLMHELDREVLDYLRKAEDRYPYRVNRS